MLCGISLRFEYAGQRDAGSESEREDTMEKWFVQAKKADFDGIANQFKIDPVTARLIRNRDVVGNDEIEYYLFGGIKDLYNPRLMKDMEQAVGIIKGKIALGKKIRIIGDYDIDGVSATYIFLTGLSRCNADVDTEIPDRIKDGYGINEQLIQLAYDQGIDTIITCDNGIAAIDQIQYAKDLGMTVIVTDHHDIPYVEEQGEKRYLSSDADAIINPKQAQCPYPFKGLCGGAVAYKLIQCLYEEYEVPQEELYELLEYAAIATVGDIMDLVCENRIIVKEGLKRLRKTKNPGLEALIQLNGIHQEKISAYHIGFIIGPCINASGRLDTAKRSLELLQAANKKEARRLAGDLKGLNDSRKAMTREGYEEAMNIIETSSIKEDKVIVMYLSDCHESLAGIIAGRIRERYHKPVFVLTKAEDGVKGSGRSIEAYNMFEEMVKCRHLFTKFGGHSMAAGLSIEEHNIEKLRQVLNENTTLTEDDFIAKVSIDAAMPIHYLTEAFTHELELLEPFGKENQKPLFAEKNLKVIAARIIGKNKNVLKLQVLNSAGICMEAVYFGDLQLFNTYITERFGSSEMEKMYQNRENKVHLSCTYYPDINEYNGNKTLQIVIRNYQ